MSSGTYFDCLSDICNNCRLKVILANEALAIKSQVRGTYEISNTVNGKPSWKSGNGMVIWYRPGYNRWIIGPTDRLLTPVGTY